MSFASAITTPESAIAGMLAVLRLMAERFVDSFGAPSALAVGGPVWGKTRERILRWLHDMECVVRRLLLLRASLLPAPILRAPRGVRVYVRVSPLRRREGDAVALFGLSDDSAQWRVCFRMPAPPEPAFMLSAMLAGMPSRAPMHSPVSSYVNGHRVEADQEASGKTYSGPLAYNIDDPRPLAERFEALLRVIDDHEHYAARLAQRLYLWRGRHERREIFLQSLCAKAPIANEADLCDAEWAHFGAARDLTLKRIPVFSKALAVSEPGDFSAPDPHSLPPPGAGP